MQPNIQFARWLFRVAGVYGLLAITPLFFSEARFGRDFPPPINHPEYFHGFASVGFAWQVLFLVLASDPLRYRLMMLPAFLEKAGFALVIGVLFLQQRVSAVSLVPALVDLILGVLFLVAFWKTRDLRQQGV